MIGKLFWMVVGGAVALKGRRKAIDTVDQYIPVGVQRQIVKQARRLADEFTQNEQKRKADAPIDVQATQTTRRPGGPTAAG